jgi:hypothetical protein
MNITAPFVRRPVATTLLTIGLALSGMLALRRFRSHCWMTSTSSLGLARSDGMTRRLHGLAAASTMEAGPLPSGRSTNWRAWKLRSVLRWLTLNTVVIASRSRTSR